MHHNIDHFHSEQLPSGSFCLELGEDRVGVDQSLDRTLEEHEDHHDAEDLQAVSGHVHHDTIHGDLLGGREGDLPSFFELEGVCFGGFGWDGRGLLLRTLGGGRWLGMLMRQKKVSFV